MCATRESGVICLDSESDSDIDDDDEDGARPISSPLSTYLENARIRNESNYKRFPSSPVSPPPSPVKRRKRSYLQNTTQPSTTGSTRQRIRKNKKKKVLHSAAKRELTDDEFEAVLCEFGSTPVNPIDLTEIASSDESDGCDDHDELQHSSSSSSTDTDVEYLNDDQTMPIYSRYNKLRTSSLTTVTAILDCPSHLVCSNHPTHISISCALVVDTSHLRDSNDILCDDCGAWTQTKTATSHLRLEFYGDGTVKSARGCKPNTKNSYTLIRRHYTCKSSPDLSRHISILKTPRGKPETHQFVQYRFSGAEHRIQVKSHGNSKKSTKGYKRTCPSTLNDLKQELLTHPPKRAMFKVEQKRGGIVHTKCQGDLPRNSAQASRLKCKKATTTLGNPSNDPIQALVVKFKEQSGQPDQFVQCIQLVPDPVVVLFNETQLADIEQFCANEGSSETSVLGVDVTFNLGPFYVTICTYQNLKVVTDKGNHPAMIGPTLIHSSKNTSNFSYLFNQLVKDKPSLATSLKAFGTDGEQALINAASEAFPYAVHLRCSNHLKDNISENLRKMMTPDALVKEVLKDIFGTATEKGLIHAPQKEFDSKLTVLEKRWKALEREHHIHTPRVFQWCRLHVFPVIRDSLNTELLHSLGIQSEKYTQNSSESVNALLKRYVSFKKQDVCSFVNDLEECVLEQQNEMSKAVLGLGRWKLASGYDSVRVSTDDWFTSMSSDAKTEAIHSLHKAPLVSPPHTTPANSQPTIVPEPSNSPHTSGQPNSQKTFTLSVPYSLLSEILSEGELKSLWAKAARLMQEKKVVPAPGSSDSWWVCSESGSLPHVVTKSKLDNGRYLCNKACVGWKSKNICAHCLAVAETCNQLKNFVTWFRSSTSNGGNLTSAVYHGTYKHAGQKKPTRRKYGDPVHMPLDQKTDRIPLQDTTNAAHMPPPVTTHSTPPVSTGHIPVTTNNTIVLRSNNVIASSLNSLIQSGNQPHLQILSQLLGSKSNSRFPAKPAVIKSEKPFFLLQLNNRIKKCAGCGLLFRNTGSDHQYILGHQERDWYPAENKWNVGNLQNKYYHLSKDCILQRCAVYHFPQDMANLEVNGCVPDHVRVLLSSEFNIVVP